MSCATAYRSGHWVYLAGPTSGWPLVMIVATIDTSLYGDGEVKRLVHSRSAASRGQRCVPNVCTRPRCLAKPVGIRPRDCCLSLFLPCRRLAYSCYKNSLRSSVFINATRVDKRNRGVVGNPNLPAFFTSCKTLNRTKLSVKGRLRMPQRDRR